MAEKKYIGTKDAARLTGLSIDEIYELIHSGELPAHKAPKSGWRISLKDLEALELIKEEQNTNVEAHHRENGFSYVADEEHYTEIFKRMTEVKHSLKIATGDLKNFNVNIEGDNGDEALRLCNFFLLLVERGVHVEIVAMKPLLFYLYAKENCPQLLENPLFELRYNGHSHMKIFIFDDECAYIGSANITSAAIGKRANGKRNYEAGMLVWGGLVQAPLHHFERVWNDPDILKSSWKRFATKAKELEKEVKEKYGR